jgi:antitoxin (DNA-binding transcriptional repressor) of toxin-antitoxin stability system
MSAITISIRDLHARTGHFVRQAVETPLIITDNGKPIAEIHRLAKGASKLKSRQHPKWQERVLLPGYAAIMNQPVAGDSSLYISEDRDRGGD